MFASDACREMRGRGRRRGAPWWFARCATHAATCGAGIGRAIQYPCAMSQPNSVSRRRMRASSTPSAMDVSPSFLVSSIVDATMISSAGRSAMVLTNERSILIRSTGSSRRFASDEWPVPKSSIANVTPIARSDSSAPAARARSASSALSVSSSSSIDGSTPCNGDERVEPRRETAGLGDRERRRSPRPSGPGRRGTTARTDGAPRRARAPSAAP